MGMGLGREPKVQRLALEPGDRLTLVTDGTFEARPDGGEPYGEVELSRRLHDYRSLPPGRRLGSSSRQSASTGRPIWRTMRRS
jgi:serine phosphatase RsbU (regulator of sigma subunit)